jgi:anaerobic selenocysteine-containing dehydrogenase/ferredoxin
MSTAKNPLRYEAKAPGEDAGGRERKSLPLWRSLDEKNEPAKAAERNEAPIQIGTKTKARRGGLGRRDLFMMAGASAAAVTAAGCLRRPVEYILPYARGPEYAQPGVALHFATSVSLGGEALGLLVESHEGRPTKIEGNPNHPSSRGATDARFQGIVLDLYDDDRSAQIRWRDAESGQQATWEDFDAWWRAQAEGLGRGQGLAVLMPPSASPSVLRAREAFLARFPEARFHTWTPEHRAEADAGVEIAFGGPREVSIDYGRTSGGAILSLDCDFLGHEPGHVVATQRFAAGRRLNSPADDMSRLYAVEGSLTLTGMNADHRLRLRPSQIEQLFKALVVKMVEAAAPRAPIDAALVAALGDTSAPEGVSDAWLTAVAEDLMGHPGQSVVVAGRSQPARVHALAHAINAALLAIATPQERRTPVVTVSPALDGERQNPVESIGALVEAMNGGQVSTLLILGGNPVYDAPGDLAFAEALSNVEATVHLSSHVDETSAAVGWHLPMAHPLEAWGDHRASNGTVSIQQPLIAPLRGGRSPGEVLAMVAGIRAWRGYHLVRNTLRAMAPSGIPFEQFWRSTLHRGVAQLPERSAGQASLDYAAVARAFEGTSPAAAEGWEIAFQPSYQVGGGQQANNPWLLEMPDPVTKIVWGNAAIISRASAAELGVTNGDLVTVSLDGASSDVQLPAYILPGHADNVVTLNLGFGRQASEQVDGGEPRGGRFLGYGASVYPLRTAAAQGFATGASVTKAGGTGELVYTQEHHSMTPRVDLMGTDIEFPERAIAIEGTREEYRERPNFAQWAEPTPHVGSVFDNVDYSQPPMPAQGGESYHLVPNFRRPASDVGARYKWGMSIDLNSCTGCGACVVACVAENNIPMVGKRQVSMGREMHWLRIDRYFSGNSVGSKGGVPVEDDPQVVPQMVPCMQCENAPCENGLPGQRDGAQRPGSQRHGLQPLHRHPLLQQQLPLQGAPVQLAQLPPHHAPEPAAGLQPDVTVRMSAA